MRDELGYILDSADVLACDLPSDSFRLVNNSKIKQRSEARTQILVLDTTWKVIKVETLRQ